MNLTTQEEYEVGTLTTIKDNFTGCKSLDDVFHAFRYNETDSFVMLTPEIVFVFSSIHGTPLYFVDSINQFLDFKMRIYDLCHALSFMTDNFLDDLV